MAMFRFVSLLFCFVLALSFSSCKKLGCRDINSISYDESAKKDDGSCVYQGNLTIWFNQAKSNVYIGNGVAELRFYLNNVYVGSSFPPNFSSIVPTCGDPNTFGYLATLGKVAKRNYTLTVRDENEVFISTHGVVISGNACTVFELP